MKVKDLLQLLEDADPEAEVRIAVQPSYPLQHRAVGFISTEELSVEEAEEVTGETEAGAVWILASESHPDEGSPYGRREWWEGQRWW